MLQTTGRHDTALVLLEMKQSPTLEQSGEALRRSCSKRRMDSRVVQSPGVAEGPKRSLRRVVVMKSGLCDGCSGLRRLPEQEVCSVMYCRSRMVVLRCIIGRSEIRVSGVARTAAGSRWIVVV